MPSSIPKSLIVKNTMKFTQLLPVIALAFVAGLSSCETVIDVDIDPADAQVVIEAELTQGPGPHLVYLRKSVAIDQSSVYPNVEGATVILRDDLGTVDTLAEFAPGGYATSHLIGTPGRTYTLSVSTEGRTFTAESTMPAPVPMDSLYNQTVNFFDGLRYPVFALITDPAGTANQYRYITWVNGIRRAGSVVTEDDTFDGQSTRIFIQGPGAQIEVGDTVRVQMQAIDPAVYEYFASLSSTGDGPGASSAPANPYTNLQGGAIGFFSAHAVDERTFVVR